MLKMFILMPFEKLIIFLTLIETAFTNIILFESIYATEQTESRDKIIDYLRINSYNTRTAASCAYHCLQIKKCISFFYHPNKQKCHLHSVMFPETAFWVPKSGWKYFQVYGEQCPPTEGYVHNRELSLCYKYYPAPDDRDWLGATDRCNNDHAELVKVDTAEKQTHLEDYLGYAGYSDQKIYIQGSDAITEGLWVFDNGQEMPFKHWLSSGNGKTENEDYLTMVTYDRYGWDDVDGTEQFAFFCQRK